MKKKNYRSSRNCRNCSKSKTTDCSKSKSTTNSDNKSIGFDKSE